MTLPTTLYKSHTSTYMSDRIALLAIYTSQRNCQAAISHWLMLALQRVLLVVAGRSWISTHIGRLYRRNSSPWGRGRRNERQCSLWLLRLWIPLAPRIEGWGCARIFHGFCQNVYIQDIREVIDQSSPRKTHCDQKYAMKAVSIHGGAHRTSVIVPLNPIVAASVGKYATRCMFLVWQAIKYTCQERLTVEGKGQKL